MWSLKKKTHRFILSCFLLTASLCTALFFKPFNKPPSVDVAKILGTLPKDERKALEWFFECLNQDTFSYVLFGDKPMAICSFLDVHSSHSTIQQYQTLIDNTITKFQSANLLAIKGWETWKKYQYLFHSSNFALRENRDHEEITIVMINKDAFLKKAEENIDAFREVLGPDITSQKLLNDCLDSNDIFRGVLKSDDKLFGILLGYGRHNSELFSRMNQIRKSLKSKEPIAPSREFSSTDEEYQCIQAKLVSFNELGIPDFNPLFMPLPSFAADRDDPETQQLKIEYMRQYKSIIKEYEKGEFLEIILKRFCL